MPLSRETIELEARNRGFKVRAYTPGPGCRVDIELKDEGTDRIVTVGLYPESTEAELAGLLFRAAGETRGDSGQVFAPHGWMM